MISARGEYRTGELMVLRKLVGVLLTALMVITPVVSPAQDVQVWLDSGEIELELENGETVNLKEGEFLSCDGTDCKILPLAAAPVRPEFVSLAAGGVAPGALGMSAGTLAAVGVAGAAVIAAGVIIGIAAAGGSTTSTTD